MLRRFIDWYDRRNRNFIMDESEYSGDEHARLSGIFNSLSGLVLQSRCGNINGILTQYPPAPIQ